MSDDVPPYAIGAETWPGLAKLTEECGELLAVVGRLMAFPDGVDHADRGGGSLLLQLGDEMADVVAAIEFVTEANRLPAQMIGRRRSHKLSRFWRWHQDATTGEERRDV